jgi:UDP-N-acetylglucosamine:LPS N-acetylglucosamine transferase
MSDRRALLLTGSIGMGHDQLAEACATSLESSGWSTATVDLIRLLGTGVGAASGAVIRSMQAVPGALDAFHFSVLRTGNRLAELADAGSRHRLAPRLRSMLDADPPDLALSVFATGASAIGALAERYPSMRHIVFCTDATPHRLWIHPGVDLYLVTSQVAERAVRRFQPDAQILVVQAPVRAAFYHPPSRTSARSRFGVPDAEPCVLLMSGSWGIGPVAEAAEALGDAGVHVLAVAGRNGKLEGKLRAAARRQPLVHAFGFSDRIPELMAACDLVITSSGDTCTEARTVGRPLLILDVVQGHGRDNLQHELELGDAAVTSARARDVVRAALAALEHAGPLPAAPTRSLAAWEGTLATALDMVGL